MTRLYAYVPRDKWLSWLAQGWAFGSPDGLPIADVLSGRHGDFSVMLWKRESA